MSHQEAENVSGEEKQEGNEERSGEISSGGSMVFCVVLFFFPSEEDK